MFDFGGAVQHLLHASQQAQTSYLRPDDYQVRGLRRLWWRKKNSLGPGHADMPVYDDAGDALRAQRQRNLMNTGSAEPVDPAQD